MRYRLAAVWLIVYFRWFASQSERRDLIILQQSKFLGELEKLFRILQIPLL